MKHCMLLMCLDANLFLLFLHFTWCAFNIRARIFLSSSYHINSPLVSNPGSHTENTLTSLCSLQVGDKWKVLVAQSCLTLCDPLDCSPPVSSVHGILEAILGWVASPFSRESSQPRDQTQVSCIAVRFFTVWATRKASLWVIVLNLESKPLFCRGLSQCEKLCMLLSFVVGCYNNGPSEWYSSIHTLM